MQYALPLTRLWRDRDDSEPQKERPAEAVLAPSLAAMLPGRQAILVTGGTGFIGTRLCSILAESGHRVTVLTRDPRKGRKFKGRVTLIDNLATLGRDTPFDAIVNLAGEPMAAGRWTSARRRLVIESRVETTRAVVKLIARSRRKPSVLVSASAIGFYGSDERAIFTEQSAPLPAFTHDVCVAWEREALEAERPGTRVCLLRTGLVLGSGGGALARMLPAFARGLGAGWAAAGNGCPGSISTMSSA